MDTDGVTSTRNRWWESTGWRTSVGMVALATMSAGCASDGSTRVVGTLPSRDGSVTTVYTGAPAAEDAVEPPATSNGVEPASWNVYCTAVVDAMSSITVETETTLTGVFAAGRAPSGVGSLFERIGEGPTPEMTSVLVALGAAMDTRTASLTQDAVMALSQSVGAGAVTLDEIRSLDELTSSNCGYTLVGDGTIAAMREVSPQRRPAGVAVGSIYGIDRGCNDRVVKSGRLVAHCDGGFVVLDLTTLEPLSIRLPADQMMTSWGAGGDILAATGRIEIPQQGLEPASTVLMATGWSLVDGSVAWQFQLEVPEAPSADEYVIEEYGEIVLEQEIVGVSSRGVTAIDSPMSYACGFRIPGYARAVGPDGAILWRTDHIWSVQRGLVVAGTGNDRGDCGDEVPYRGVVADDLTGAERYVGSHVEFESPRACSTWFETWHQTYSSDPPNQYVNVRTGAQVSAPDDSFLIGPAANGLLLQLSDGSVGFLDETSTIRWTHPEGVLTNLQFLNGEIILTDGQGAHIVIDQATGQEAGRLNVLPNDLVDNGRWDVSQGDGGVLVYSPADPRWACAE